MNESHAAETVPETIPVVAVTHFNVKNRASANRLAKILYGPTGRVWVNRVISNDGDVGVQVGTEQGSRKEVKAAGVDFAEALEADARAFVLAAGDFKDTQNRMLRIDVAGGESRAFLQEAYERFPQGRKILTQIALLEEMASKGKAEAAVEAPAPVEG